MHPLLFFRFVFLLCFLYFLNPFCYNQGHARVRAEAALPQGYQGTKFTLVNNCSETVWAASKGINGSLPAYDINGSELPIGSSRAFDVPSFWRGHFWGRTKCNFDDSNNGTCATGDTIATIAVFYVGIQNSTDLYAVTIEDGFNLPLRIDPVGGSDLCNSTGCVADLIRRCPQELRTIDGGTCLSGCTAFNTDAHCCKPCTVTVYSQLFKEACPLAYNDGPDDNTNTFTCSTSHNYIITFCASSILGQNVSESDGRPPFGLGPSPNPYFPRTSDPKTSSSPIVVILGVTLGGTGSIILAIIIVCYIKRRRVSEGRYHKNNQDIENFLFHNGPLSLKRYDNSEIEEMIKPFNDNLGEGAYGTVYKGELPDKSLVAVKVLFKSINSNNVGDFINEVATISRTSHVNIVKMLGFCFDRNMRALVYEYMPNKSVRQFIENNSLDSEMLYKIVFGVGKGLEYLHSFCNNKIVHFDIKPENILLDEDLCPKIADFGLARLCKKTKSISSMFQAGGTHGYAAPEIFYRDIGRVSHKSDVYSYGKMLLELAERKKIVNTAIPLSGEYYLADRMYMRLMIDVKANLDCFEIEEEEETLMKIILIGFWCIQVYPPDRPSMSKVLEMLEGNVHSIPIPPKPGPFNPAEAREFFWSCQSMTERENSGEDYFSTQSMTERENSGEVHFSTQSMTEREDLGEVHSMADK